MTAAALGLVALFLVVLLLSVKPLGTYIACVLEGGHPLQKAAPAQGASPGEGATPGEGAGRFWPLTVGAPLERLIYRLCGIEPAAEMSWKSYALAVIAFNAVGGLALYALQRLQAWLPLNPQGFANVSPDSAFNTAVSFITNTNWQGYVGETSLGYLVQMTGLAVQNFLSAATGIVVAIALIRGFARHDARSIGNVWVDLTRSTLYILLPLATVIALILVQQGVVQSFSPYREATTLEPVAYSQPKLDAAGHPVLDASGQAMQESMSTRKQTLPMGPVASQEAIKELGTNGGGFFNANSAHPYENPTPISNLLEILAIVLIPAALTYTFGRIVGDPRQGWALLATMLILGLALLSVVLYSEQLGNPRIGRLGVDQAASLLQSGGNMEGKEVRFGIAASALFAMVTTGTSCGAVNSMFDSFTPLGGFVPLFDMQLGEVVFGGVGTGLYSMLVFAIIGVFIAGLMIGRTPEYLGKKLESFEMKMSSIAILVMPFLVLIGTAIAVSSGPGRAGASNPGAHGFSEILYAFTSAGNNNGSAFAGINASTPFYNTALGVVMWLGRYVPIVAVLAIAGSLAGKKRVPVTAGTMVTYGPTFVILLIGTVLLVGALTFVPALALGPVVEHLVLWGG
jgi:K+-transporting ATPase ATPase A chain